MTKEITAVLVTGEIASISFQCNLIMMHTDFLSAQWEPNKVGIEVSNFEDVTKLGFHTRGDNCIPAYQSWYFKGDEFEKILAWFKALGFPCPQYPTLS